MRTVYFEYNYGFSYARKKFLIILDNASDKIISYSWLLLYAHGHCTLYLINLNTIRKLFHYFFAYLLLFKFIRKTADTNYFILFYFNKKRALDIRSLIGKIIYLYEMYQQRKCYVTHVEDF